ncbi:MAG: tripartite tricarboxylate transporter substrate binding protein [Rhodovarius sp.]|nr:tripartite tricarboxylate transporter substrate binding protein [Rhodovarius sp.]MCX7933542.1 tripartite tricarboxylate transporter substrate binding protein [Rhodovarius sp.]MDW8313694.1 tripartite tricarboxylate transporter substrate binding protein [Rhodovarius sp.]
MRITRRRLMAGAAGMSGLAAPALAQPGWPSRPVTIVAPSAPGASPDVFSRILTEPLQRRLGRPFAVENRPGAGGVVGTAAVIRAPADGHTLLFASSSPIVVAPHLRRPPPYVSPRDLVPIVQTLAGPSIIVVSREIRANTIEELVAELRASPGRFNLGSHGVGSFSHVSMEMFMAETGTEMVHVPFNGGALLAQGVMQGQVHVALFDVLNGAPLVRNGYGRVLAQVGEQRSPIFPDVPLVSETVAPAVNSDFWLGLFAPAGTDPAIIERLHREVSEIMAEPANQRRVADASMLAPALTQAQFQAKVEREWEVWGRVIRERNIVAA